MKNHSHFTLFFLFFFYSCTVKKVKKIAIIGGQEHLNVTSLEKIIDTKLGIVEVFHISSFDSLDNKYENINSRTYDKFWHFFSNKKQKIPLKISQCTPLIKYSDNQYTLSFGEKQYEADIIIWALPIDSLQQNRLIGIDSLSFRNSMLLFQEEKNADLHNILNDVYFLGKFPSKEKGKTKKGSVENTWNQITTNLISKMDEK